MIQAKMKYKKPALTLDQKALKKAITPLARETKNNVKNDAPKGTGALKFAIDFRTISRKGWSAAIIGVKSKYSKVVKGKEKIPNLYALRVGMKKVILKYVNQTAVDKLKESAARVVQQMLEGKK